MRVRVFVPSRGGFAELRGLTAAECNEAAAGYYDAIAAANWQISGKLRRLANEIENEQVQFVEDISRRRLEFLWGEGEEI